MRHAPPLRIRNAQVWDGDQTIHRDLYTANGRTVDQPANGAYVVNLDGYTIFPGLINAHDHLELNHYPRSKFREVYDNAHQWGEDMNSRLNSEPYKSLRAYPLWDKVFIGGLKNLLCGATTVAHHNTLYRPLKSTDFPVRVLQKYGWTHSLHFSREDDIIRSYKVTPRDSSWFIHLAEGTDEIASGEYQYLKKLGCVRNNTVLVHGVGVSQEDIEDAAQIIRGVVWCPSSNHYLLGNTIQMSAYTRRGWPKGVFNIALGSDSRLTASKDLLGEMSFASEGMRIHPGANCDAYCILEAVSNRAAAILNLKDIGHLKPDAHADWLVWRYRIGSERADLALIVKDGLPRIGDPDIMAKFPHVQTVAATLDGVEKRIHVDLARQIHRCQLKEPGLEVDALPKKPFYLF